MPGSSAAGPPSSEISLGCVLATDDEQTRAQLDALCRFLSGEIDWRVRPRVAPSPAALAAFFGAGELDLVWASPTLALLSPPLRAGVPVVRSVRQGAPHYHGVLFVRHDAPIHGPLQLQGTRAAWVAQTSASGYIFPRIALAGHGLDPAELFASEHFYEHHGAVGLAVFQGEADVGATFAAFEQGDPTRPLVRAGYMEADSAGRARILLTTPAIPSDLVIASQVLWHVLEERLVPALEELSFDPEASQALKSVLGADGLVRCDQRALDELRRQVADAEALGVVGAG